MQFKSSARLPRFLVVVIAAMLPFLAFSKLFTSASSAGSRAQITPSTTIEDLNQEGINPALPTSTAHVTGFIVAPPSYHDGVLGDKQYQVTVPANATSLQVHVTGNQDIDLYARIGQPVTGSGNTFVADYHAANGPTGDETITITPNDTNQTPLHAGVYIFGVVNNGDSGDGTVNFNLDATLVTSGGSGGTNIITLTSGSTVTDSIPAASGGIGKLDTNQFLISVPTGATQLVVSLTSSQNVDLYVRLNQLITQSGNQFQADFSSTSNSGNETIVITPSSSPALQAGSYFIGVVNNATTTAQISLTATVTGGSQGTTIPLQSGVTQTGSIQRLHLAIRLS